MTPLPANTSESGAPNSWVALTLNEPQVVIGEAPEPLAPAVRVTGDGIAHLRGKVRAKENVLLTEVWFTTSTAARPAKAVALATAVYGALFEGLVLEVSTFGTGTLLVTLAAGKEICLDGLSWSVF